MNKRLSLLKKSLPPKGIKVKSENPAWSEVQGVLARGDIKLAEVLANILANIEQVSLSGWRKAVEKCYLDTNYYAHQRWDTTKQLPWAMIDSGTDPEKLKLELSRVTSQIT